MSMRFDDLAKGLARGESRRSVLRKLGAAVLGTAVVSSLSEEMVASAKELVPVGINGGVNGGGGKGGGPPIWIGKPGRGKGTPPILFAGGKPVLVNGKPVFVSVNGGGPGPIPS